MARSAVLSAGHGMKRRAEYRFQAPDRETIERLAALSVADAENGVAMFRDVFYDTGAHDLESRGAIVRLRLAQDGAALLSVHVLERRGEDGIAHMRSDELEIGESALEAPFTADPAATRLVRALVEPARLQPVLELETLRRVVPLGADTAIACDVITVRSGELSSDLFEVELAGGDEEKLRAHARTLQEQHGLRPLLTETVTRARDLFAQLEVSRLEVAVRAAREVAVVVHDRGSIALVRRRDRLSVPSAAGFGPRACRRALRRAFGQGGGRLRLLGVHGDVPGRPSVQVWLAEDVRADDSTDVVWLPIDRALDRAALPGMRDARTLVALQVVARSNFKSWAPPPGGVALAPRGPGRSEPFELVLQRLEASDVAFEQPATDVSPDLLLNMELSRLGFDERVLAIAEDHAVPLLERLRFLGMFGERRDDFFMSRVAHFKRLLARGSAERSMDGLTPAQQLDAIAIRAREMTHRAYELLNRRLLPELTAHGILIVRGLSLSEEDRAHLRNTYGAQLEALVIPLAADPAHPFPHVRNLRPALAAIVRMHDDGTEQFIAVELPGELPRFVPLPGGRRFVPLEDVIESILPELYPGLEIVRAHTFRVTRSAQMDLAGEPLDMLQLVEEEVTRRPFQEVVRLEVEHAMPPEMRYRLLREFQYELEEQLSMPGEQDVYTVGRLVDLASLKEIAAMEEPTLHFEPLEPRDPLDPERPVFDQIREQERLLHFPWDRFDRSVERFISEAAADDGVVSIRVTLYRTDRDSRIVAALREARARGKDVAVLLELKASFDEQRNIEWARELEQDGIRVSFSPVRFKVHAKIALVVRREENGLRRYAYIGTGNLNAATARSYVDLGLLTCDGELTREVGAVFNLLTGYSGGGEIRRLIVAPFDMRRRLLQLIDREMQHAQQGRPAHIRIQLNGLADRRLIGALYRASQAGVRIEMMVREICALRPGVPGISDNITVVSVVGRLLQHSRILHVHNAGQDEYYIGSADWRPRNLNERVEVVTPITHPDHIAQLDRILHETLNDPGAWRLDSSGQHVRS
jgi:polyphosphate kinase